MDIKIGLNTFSITRLDTGTWLVVDDCADTEYNTFKEARRALVGRLSQIAAEATRGYLDALYILEDDFRF